jgi:hypothetical protein
MRVLSDREACSIGVRLARPIVGAALGAVWLCVITAGFSAPKTISPSEFVLGQRPFSPSSSWNTPIAASAAYTKLNWPAPNAYNYGVAWKSYSPSVRQGLPSDPLVSVTYPPGWGYAGGHVQVRMPLEASGAAGTDGELLLIESGVVHNFWQLKRQGVHVAAAQSYGAANLLKDSGWGSRSRGAGITAAGSSQLAGLLVQAETNRGEIAHALQISIERSLAKPGHSGEAIASDGTNPNGIVQEGDRLAIPPKTPMPSGLSPLGRKVFRAYQKFGAFVVDVAGGVTNLRAQANAYDAHTIARLQRDVVKLTPLLERVQ